MKQGNLLLRIIVILIFLLFVGYAGYAAFQAIYSPLTTTTAIEYTAGEACFTTGYILRDETVLASSYPITVVTRSEGERVGVGQTVAVAYQDDDAKQRQAELTELQDRLTQMEYAYSSDWDYADISVLEENIASYAVSIAAAINQGDFSTLSSDGEALKSVVLRRYSDSADSEAIQAEMQSLTEDIARLSAETSSGSRSITVTESGVFSGVVDGYETLFDIGRLDQITVDDLENTEEHVSSPRSDAFGKMIHGNTWYFATILSESYADRTEAGEKLTVSFSQNLFDDIKMTVESISAPDADGRCVVILSCDRYLSSVTMLRHVSAEIVFSTYSGLRVPKNALQLDEENKPGVYVLEGSSARWKNVELLYDNGESYVVKLDKSSTGNLWPGDEIILGTKDLFDGKVVMTE